MHLLAEAEECFPRTALALRLQVRGFEELSRPRFGLYQIGGLGEPTTTSVEVQRM